MRNDSENRSRGRFGRREFMAGVGVAAVVGTGLTESGSRAAAATPAGPSIENVWGWLPSPAHVPGHLLVVDAGGIGANTLVALSVMQGLANTRLTGRGTAAYLRIPPTPNNYPEGVFNLWPSIYAKQLGITYSDGTSQDIAELARRRGVNRYVVWDPDVPATMNVATTLSWIHGTAAFSPADAAGPLAAGMTRFLDLRSLHFADEVAAYRWALNQLPESGAAVLAVLSDGGPDAYLPNAVVWTPRDYAVHARAFTWIFSFGSETYAGAPDDSLTNAIVGSVPPSTPTMFGWSNNESAQTIFASRRGWNFVGADTPGIPAENLTLHNAIRTGAVQAPAPDIQLEPGVVYACVIYTDGDNIGTLIQYHLGRWPDDKRGQVPVGWSMQGMAPSWTPGLARYYFDSSTENDEMVAWLPFGYPDLASFVDEPNWPEWVESTHRAMTAAGLRVSQDLPHSGAVLSEKASGWWDLLHGSNPPEGHIVGYTGPRGPYPAGEALWINGRPILHVSGGTGSTPSDRAASGVTETMAQNDERPLFVVTGLGNGTTYQDAIDTVTRTFGGTVKFVRPEQLIRLQREAWQRGLAGTTLLGLTGSVIDLYFLASGGESSEQVLFTHDGRTTQARQVSAGGHWSYRFNVEGCRTAILTIDAIGAGSIEVSSDGERWDPVTEVDAPAGHYSTVTASVLRSPAAHLWLRFTSAPDSVLTVTWLRVVYNGRHQGTSVEVAPLRPGSVIVSFPSLTAEQTATPPPLDGSASGQWTTAEPITVTPSDSTVQQFGKVWGVPPQGGTIKALWDAEHLYVLAQIADKNIMAPSTTSADGAPWLDDGVAIYLASDTWGFKVAATVPTSSGESLVYYQQGTPSSTSGNGAPDPSAARVGFLRTADGYNLAMAIPWHTLVGYSAEAGDSVRFTPLILDRQGAATSEWGQVMWCGDDDTPQLNGYLQLAT